MNRVHEESYSVVMVNHVIINIINLSLFKVCDLLFWELLIVDFFDPI